MNKNKPNNQASKQAQQKNGEVAPKNDVLALNNAIISDLSKKGYIVRFLSCGNLSISSKNGHLAECGVRLTKIKALVKNKVLYETLDNKDIKALMNSTPKTHPFGIDFEVKDLYKLVDLLNKQLNKTIKA